ncbi:hypothetical protein PENVUL_c119G05503 [Penicillium vulpinum]|uniref:Uncharacterized protein n=2 Tax=Penicillium vulpinum TaxID=29845 RepID=A0A1V6R128_9EURO|nr:hypothetical protein PENVUL_c119G05503 [Penicillium vulpinum]
MELRRLRGLTPAAARQLFTSTVAPVVDYASNVWMHACTDKAIGPINRVQRLGAQAIVGTFLTVATSVAEAEAHLATVQHRFWRRAVKMWTDIHTLPETNPLRRNTDRIRKFQRSRHGPVCVWTSERDRGALPISMSKMDGAPDGTPTMYQHPPRKFILLPKRTVDALQLPKIGC